MKLSNFAAYIAQLWRNKPDTSTPLSAERLRHIEDGIKGNSDAIEAIAAAVINQIVNDPDKIASMAALYAVNQKVSALDGKVGDTAQLPDGATDVVTAIAKQNSDMSTKFGYITDGADLSIIQKGIHFYNGWASASMINGVAPFSNINGIWIRSIPYDSIASNILDVVIAEDGTIYTSIDKGNTWSSK